MIVARRHNFQTATRAAAIHWPPTSTCRWRSAVQKKSNDHSKMTQVRGIGDVIVTESERPRRAVGKLAQSSRLIEWRRRTSSWSRDRPHHQWRLALTQSVHSIARSGENRFPETMTTTTAATFRRIRRVSATDRLRTRGEVK
jgi:hypothetical protein